MLDTAGQWSGNRSSTKNWSGEVLKVIQSPEILERTDSLPAQGRDDLTAESRKIIGSAGSDEIAVPHHLLVQIFGPGIYYVVLDGRDAGGLLPLQDPG